MLSTKNDLKRGNVAVFVTLIVLLFVFAAFGFKDLFASPKSEFTPPVQADEWQSQTVSRFVLIDSDKWYCAQENDKGGCLEWRNNEVFSDEN